MIEIFKALSDPCRIRLTAILMRGEFTVQELTAIIGTGQSRISHHLKILVAAGLIRSKRQGTWSYYSVNEGNDFFCSIRPFIDKELITLPERSADLASIAAVFENRRKRNLDFFNHHARQWDDLVKALLPLPDYRQKILDLLPSGGNFLEIGVGTGFLVMELARTGARVIGVDHSAAMLDEARRRLIHNGIADVDLRLGEMTHLPLSDASIDCVIANMVLHHADDPIAVILEARRVLVTGGLLVVADLARHELEVAREQLADQWLGFEVAELAGWLREAGFGFVSTELIEGTTDQSTVLLVNAR